MSGRPGSLTASPAGVAPRARAAGGLPASTPRRRGLGYALLALLSYVPILLTAPGKVAADTKQYLYLDPGRLLAQAPSMWDPNIGMGTVTHQTIGYLFPMGPFYWVLETLLRMPAWVAQRLWLGSLLFFAALGMLYLFRAIGLRGPGAPVGALMFMLTPYVLDYSARISVILMPWAALGWMLAFVVLALRRGGWRYPALFAITVQIVGGVNATALLFAGIAPVLWIPYSIWVAHEATLRRGWEVLWKTGVLTLVTSLWWISGLWAQGSYGLDILRFTETLQAVSQTSLAPEVLRGLGYWFFYGQDKIGPWTPASVDYTQHLWLIVVSYAIPTLALLSAAFVRWKHRIYFAVIALVGVAIAVGAHPYAGPAPFGALFKHFALNSTAGFALRSTGRAMPLVVLGLAALMAAGVNAAARWLAARERPMAGLAVVGVIGALVIVNLPALWDGSFYGPNLERPEQIPTYWKQAIAALDAQPHDTRILAIPGADFASYRWGNTVDPITPGLTDRPFVARELIPWGSPPSADLLNAFDRQLQEGVLDPAAIAPISRLMSAGDLLLRMDLATDRYNLIRPVLMWRMFSPTAPPGVDPPVTFGTKIPGHPHFPQIDEKALALPPNVAQPPPVAVAGVQDVAPIVHAVSDASPVIVDGGGEGLVDIAPLGLLPDGRAVLYSGTFAKDPDALRSEAAQGATLVLTDSNRKRARRWSTVLDNLGYTEQADVGPLSQDPSDARLDLFPGTGTSTQTVAVLNGPIKSVQATGYGNPVSYTPEDRAERAVDGETFTSWKVAAFGNADGQRLKIVLKHPITTDHVNLVQPLNGPRSRYVTDITMTFDGKDRTEASLGPESRDPSAVGQTLHFPKRTFSSFEIRIDDTNYGDSTDNSGKTAVGFAEVRLQDETPGSVPATADEITRLPTDMLGALGASSRARPLAIVMTRYRVYPTPPRYDPELNLVREFTLPTGRSFDLSGQVRVNDTVPDQQLDALLGTPGPAQGGLVVSTSQHLAADVSARGSAAIDGDPTTAWNTQFSHPQGQWIQIQSPSPVTFDHMNLQVVNDGRHSVPTRLTISNESGETRVVDVPPVPDQSAPNGTVTIPLRFAPITGGTIRVTIDAVRPITTLEYFSVQQDVMPVGIAELGIPGLQQAPVPAAFPSTCRADLLTVDGKPVPVRIVGTNADAVGLQPLQVELCDPAPSLDLGPGPHVLRTAEGGVTGLNFDQVVLSSAAGGAAAPVSSLPPAPTAPPSAPSTVGAAPASGGAPPTVKVTSKSRTSMKLQVEGATSPSWLVLGQSLDPGWHASLDGKDLGAPTLISGYANGWRLPASKAGAPMSVTLTWTPQRVVWGALAVSALALLACLAIVVLTAVRRRRRRAPRRARDDATLLDEDVDHALSPIGGRPAAAAIVATTVGTGLLAGLLVRPWAGPVVAAATLIVLLRPRLTVLMRLFPAVALGLCGLFIAVDQARFHVSPIFEWPRTFWRVRTLGWLAIVVLVTLVIVEQVQQRAADRARADE